MRTPAFWYPPNPAELSLAPRLLAPLSYAFEAGTFLRRALNRRPYRANVPVVCVGNAVAGGAGKTPTALALARILKARGQKPVFVTRGYGGTGKLVRVDPASHSAAAVGDEALLLAREAPTWVGKDRPKALRAAETEASIIVMDDGLQNPSVAPSCALLVIDGEVGIGNGRVIPAGPLRAPFEGALKKIKAAVLIGDEDRQNISARIKAPLFRARLAPDLPDGFPSSGKFLAFAGIARPEKFYRAASALGLELVKTCAFPDHHVFSPQDLAFLQVEASSSGARLITTEKDAVRLPLSFRSDLLTLPVRLVFENPHAEEQLAALMLDFAAPRKS